MRELDENPATVFTVLTGEGRFFSAGADVRGKSPLVLCLWDLFLSHTSIGSRPLDEGADSLTQVQLKVAHQERFALSQSAPRYF